MNAANNQAPNINPPSIAVFQKRKLSTWHPKYAPRHLPACIPGYFKNLNVFYKNKIFGAPGAKLKFFAFLIIFQQFGKKRPHFCLGPVEL